MGAKGIERNLVIPQARDKNEVIAEFLRNGTSGILEVNREPQDRATPTGLDLEGSTVEIFSSHGSSTTEPFDVFIGNLERDVRTAREERKIAQAEGMREAPRRPLARLRGAAQAVSMALLGGL